MQEMVEMDPCLLEPDLAVEELDPLLLLGAGTENLDVA